MAASRFLKTPISLEDKQRVPALASQLLITESVWLKRLVMRALGEYAASLPEAIATQREAERHSRVVTNRKQRLSLSKSAVAAAGISWLPHIAAGGLK